MKPSNVLVTLHDGRPLVKIIDFGIAKATGQQLTDKTLFTGFAQMVGTPLYMSPEQAALSDVDVDTRSDVYSLGVLLYELLTGTTPFEKERLSEATGDEWRRIIREDEPPRPSTRISTLAAHALSTISGRQQTDPQKLSRQLRGELDWIVMKALEKDRNRRYESASAFAADIQRYLKDEPVAACPPSIAYRARKYARRNKTILTTAIVVLTALVAGTVLSLWQAIEADKARKLADDRLILADGRLENEKQARTEADKQRKQASENLKQALDAVDQMLMRVADERLSAIPGAEPIRRELFDDALKFYDSFFAQAPDDPQLRQSTARAWARVGNLHDILSNHVKAQESRQQGLEKWEALHAENPGDPQIQAALAELHQEWGNCAHYHRHQYESAARALDRARSLYMDLDRRFPEKLEYAWSGTHAETILGANYAWTHHVEDAERCLRHAVAVQRRLWSQQPISGKKHWCLPYSLVFLGVSLEEKQSSDDEAEAVYAEAIQRGEDILTSDPQGFFGAVWLVQAALQYGNFLDARGRSQEAEKQYRRGVEAGQNLPRLAPNDFNEISIFPRIEIALANLLARDGRHAEAFSLYRAAGDLLRPAITLPGRLGFWVSICRSADQGLESSLAEMKRCGKIDEARGFCEALNHENGSGPASILSHIVAGRAWASIGEMGRSEQVFHEVLQRLASGSVSDASNPDRLRFVRTCGLLMVDHLDFAAFRDESLSAELSALAESAIATGTPDIGTYRELGVLHATLRLFDKARRDFEAAVTAGNAEGHAGWYERYQRALCYLHNEDAVAYRAAGNEMTERFKDSRKVDELRWTVWTCALAPASVDDYARLVALARRGREIAPNDNTMTQALGAALFRGGQFAEALKVLTQTEPTAKDKNSMPLDAQWFLAMTYQKLGHDSDARQSFDRAQAETAKMLAEGKTEFGATLTWDRRVTLELLRAEATEMLGPAPKGNGE